MVAGAIVLVRLHLAVDAQRVNVRYAPAASAADRLSVEKASGLIGGFEQEPLTWSYLFRTRSRSNIRALVLNPLVQDTHHIDRSNLRVALDRPDLPAMLRVLAEVGWLPWMSGVLALWGGARTWRLRRDVAFGLRATWRLLRDVLISGAAFAWGTRAPSAAVATQPRDLPSGTRQRRYCPSGLASLLSALALGAAVATFVTLMGANDLENYDHSFLSLDRGTRFETLKIFGNPAYTLALGLGVRLPLLGSLSASPAAMLAPYIPDPWTYWLLLTLAIGSAALIARHALEPLCGRLVFWMGAYLLFCSLPIVNYTISDDWPDDAVTYCCFVACVFAPHALLVVANTSLGTTRRVVGSLGLLSLVWGAIALSHPGYWPLIVLTLTVSAVLASIRIDHSLSLRLAVVAALGVTSIAVIGLLAPDVLREMWVAGDMLQGMNRPVRAPIAGLGASNWPWPLPQSTRAPFTFLLMTITSLAIGWRWRDAARGRLLLGCGLASLAFGFGAAHLSLSEGAFTPSAMWRLRDPAIGFAVLGAACAAGVLLANHAKHAIAARSFGVVLVVCGLLGPAIAAGTTLRGNDLAELFDAFVAPRGTTPPQSRMSARGLPADQVAAGSRIALWPGAYRDMRNRNAAQADFADAGYVLVTASVKQRTMKRVVDAGHEIDHNDVLFEQSTFLPADVLCSPSAMQFLQLNYLLAPAVINCNAWRAVTPTLVVDGWLTVYTAGANDSRVRALPSAAISEAMRREAALAPGSSLLSALMPLPGTSVTLGPRDVVVRQDQPSASAGRTLVLPVVYDSAWKASSGGIDNVGGLLALTVASQPRVVLSFEPDMVSILRATAMSLSQLFTCLGLVGLACVAPLAKSSALV